MTALIRSVFAHLLEVLERSDASACVELNEQLPPNITSLILSADEPTRGAEAAASLASLLKARIAVTQAALDTRLVADELRRSQKYAKPGAGASYRPASAQAGRGEASPQRGAAVVDQGGYGVRA